jgi:peptidyl-prolyl cis-trans isomerase SurA
MYNKINSGKAALIGMLLLASMAQAQPMEVDRVFAVVDDDVVLKSEFDERWAQIEEQIAQTPGPKPPLAEVRKQVLDQLILEHLQMQLAERAGVRVDDNQLNGALSQIAQDNNMTFEQFVQLLTEQGLYESTRESIRREFLIGNLQNGAVNRRIEISRQEIENYLRSEAGATQIAPEYLVAHVLIPNTAGVSAAAQAELAQLLFQRIKDGASIQEIAGSGQISGIPVSGSALNWAKVEGLPTVFQDIVPTLEAGEVGEPFTSSNGHHIVQLLETRGGSALAQNQSLVRHILIKPNEIRTEAQAEALVHALHQRIVAGEDFADVARQNTDDSESMVSGGDLDWISDGMLPPDFMEVVNATPVGTLTEPFHVSTGWHIVEVLDRRVQDVTEENKRFLAERLLRERKFETELQNWLTEMHDTHYIDIKEAEFADADEDDDTDATADASVDEDADEEETEQD